MNLRSSFALVLLTMLLPIRTLSSTGGTAPPMDGEKSQPQEQKKEDQKDTWKILRAPSTNSCIAVVITAVDPSRPELLGKYRTKADAIAALEDFKKQDDPKKANFKMCE